MVINRDVNCRGSPWPGDLMEFVLEWLEVRPWSWNKRHLGLVHWKLHQASPQVRHAIYRSTILPKVDYCCAVWDPHYSADKTALNRVQRFASRVITHKWHANHSTLLNSLNWKPLEVHRRLIKPKVCYDIYEYLFLYTLFCFYPTTLVQSTSISLQNAP